MLYNNDMNHKHGAGKKIRKRMRKIMKASSRAYKEFYTSRERPIPKTGQPTKDTSNAYTT
jgi:hypothetical protein